MSNFRRILMGQKGRIQQIEYLESTGTQMILTDYIPNPKTKIVANIQLIRNGDEYLKTNIALFGVVEEQQSFYMNHGAGQTESDYTTFYIWNNITYQQSGSVIKNTKPYGFANITKKGTLILDNNSFSFLGQIIKLPSKSGSQSKPMAIFGYNRYGSMILYKAFIMRVYSLEIYEDDILVRDFVPVRVGDIGYMYDKVSKQLFGNIGTGQFILGADV